MATRLLVEAEADRELEEAVQRYEEKRSGLGQRFLDGVTFTIDRIRRFPLAGATVPYVSSDLSVRRAPVKGFPYHVVYLHTSESIRVLAFAHYRRRPGYWLGRAN